MSNLLPCPFCGSQNVEVKNIINNLQAAEYAAVVCNNCGSQGPGSLDTDTDIDAIQLWNIRANIGDIGTCKTCYWYQDSPDAGKFGWCVKINQYQWCDDVYEECETYMQRKWDA